MTVEERLKDKTAIVTGATKGLGRGIALVLAANGVRVLVVGRDEQRGAQTVASIEQAGGTASFFKADVSSAEDVGAMDGVHGCPWPWGSLILSVRTGQQKL